MCSPDSIITGAAVPTQHAQSLRYIHIYICGKFHSSRSPQITRLFEDFKVEVHVHNRAFKSTEIFDKRSMYVALSLI